MFNNIGGKIKMLAVITCVIGMIASLICAIALFAMNTWRNNTIVPGILVLTLGCLGSWVGTFLLYGFGELIDETKRNRIINMQLLEKLAGQTEDTAARSVEGADTLRVQEPPLPVSSGGNWQCRCGTRNAVNQIFCAYCGEMNVKMQTKSKSPQSKMTSVFQTNTVTVQTKSKSPQSKMTSVFQMNTVTDNPVRVTSNMWTCSCGRKNSQGDKNCTFCGRDK